MHEHTPSQRPEAWLLGNFCHAFPRAVQCRKGSHRRAGIMIHGLKNNGESVEKLEDQPAARSITYTGSAVTTLFFFTPTVRTGTRQQIVVPALPVGLL